MTVLENSIRIDAAPEKVWSALAVGTERIEHSTNGLGLLGHQDP